MDLRPKRRRAANRRRSSSRLRLSDIPRPIIVVGVGLVILVVLVFSPIGKPDDTVKTFELTQEYGRTKRMLISTKTSGLEQIGRRTRSHRARSVSIESDGAPVRAYLLDLSKAGDSLSKVEGFMQATNDVAEGREPDSQLVRDRAVDITRAKFSLPYWNPLKPSSSYMLIFGTDRDAEVTVHISYGR